MIFWELSTAALIEVSLDATQAFSIDIVHIPLLIIFRPRITNGLNLGKLKNSVNTQASVLKTPTESTCFFKFDESAYDGYRPKSDDPITLYIRCNSVKNWSPN
ncbi:hypothetical protein EMIT0373P_11863 [Pseudomonas chlororaphis]